MKKFLLPTFTAIIIILSIFLVLPVNAENSVTVNNAKIEALTGGTLTKDDDKKEVTMTLTAEEINKLTWYEKDAPTYDEDVTRPGNGWWIGFRLTLPSDVTPSEVTRDVTNVYGASDSKPFNADDNTTDICSYWMGIDEEKLEGKTAEFTLATYKFHWNRNKTDDLTVIIRVKPEGVKLTKDPSKVVTVKVNDTIFTMLKGKTLTSNKENGGLTEQEVEKLNKLMEPEDGYKFAGLYYKGTENKFDFETVINEDINLETRFEKISKEPVKDEPVQQPIPEQPKEEKPVKDPTPKTGAENLELFATISAVLALTGIAIFKKK